MYKNYYSVKYSKLLKLPHIIRLKLSSTYVFQSDLSSNMDKKKIN